MRSRRITAILILTAAVLCLPLCPGVPRQSSPATFDGRLQAAELDSYNEAAGVWINKRILLLNTAGGELLELDNPPAELSRITIGQPVRVYGYRREQKLVVEDFEIVEYAEAAWAQPPGQRHQAEQTADTIGAQKTLVALFNFSDVQTRPFTVDSVKDKILSAAKSADNFLRENSYGKLWLEADFLDWRTLQANSNQLCPGST